MSNDLNPYAPPSASLESTEGDLWRDGKSLVFRPGTPLPPRCVKCNTPVEAAAKNRKVYWHHPALYLIVLVNILIYAIVALVVRKSAEVNPALCRVHRRRRAVGIVLGLIGSLAGIAIAIMGGITESCGLIVLSGALFLGAVIAGMVLARVVYPERIGKDFVRIRGCGRAFLDSFPPFPG